MSVIEKTFGSLAYLVAENISVPHGFTTRLGGVSKDYLSSLNLGAHRGDEPENVAENYRRLGALLGFLLGEIGAVGLAISLGFASGAMLYVVFGEILPQSILMYHSKLPAFSTIVGILVGMLIIF